MGDDLYKPSWLWRVLDKKEVRTVGSGRSVEESAGSFEGGLFPQVRSLPACRVDQFCSFGFILHSDLQNIPFHLWFAKVLLLFCQTQSPLPFSRLAAAKSTPELSFLLQNTAVHL